MPALDGKVALVGGGEHVGAIASALLDAGATVIVQSQGDVAPIAGATVVDAPVRDFAAADALVAKVVAHWLAPGHSTWSRPVAVASSPSRRARHSCQRASSRPR